MSEYLTPPSDCITTYEDVLESHVQCTTLLTLLTIFLHLLLHSWGVIKLVWVRLITALSGKLRKLFRNRIF